MNDEEKIASVSMLAPVTLPMVVAGRIVNLSNALGSLAQTGDPNSEFGAFRFIGNVARKSALNMLTVQFAAELKDSQIKVNSADSDTRPLISTGVEAVSRYQMEQRSPSV